MNREESISQVSKMNCLRFLIFFLAAIFCLYQTTAAQSGRKKDKPPAASEYPATTDTVNQPQDKEQTELVSAIKVTGEIQYDSGYHRSNYLGHALDKCVESLKGRPFRPLKVSKVGKMKLNDAKDLAKKETEAHILWIGFFVKSYSAGLNIIDYVEYIDYAVMKPNTGKVLTFGRIELGKANMGNTGTVLQIPSTNRRTAQLSQLEQGAREIAAILKRGGWLD